MRMAQRPRERERGGNWDGRQQENRRLLLKILRKLSPCVRGVSIIRSSNMNLDNSCVPRSLAPCQLMKLGFGPGGCFLAERLSR